MNISIEQIQTLLLIAAIVAMAARLLRIPYTVGLLLAGITLALLPFTPEISLTKELIFTIFLPHWFTKPRYTSAGRNCAGICL